jgi:hypothetical protein
MIKIDFKILYNLNMSNLNMKKLLKSVPIDVISIIRYYKLDIDITQITKKKYDNVLEELESIIEEGDEICDSFFSRRYLFNGRFGDYNYNEIRNNTIFSMFMFQSLNMNKVD